MSSRCNFDITNLTVTGNETTSDSIIINKQMVGYIVLTLTKSNKSDNIITKYRGYDIPHLDIRICNCSNMAWAKKQILDEIHRRYPYDIIDTMEINRSYTVVLSDSTKLKRSAPGSEPETYVGGGIRLIASSQISQLNFICSDLALTDIDQGRYGICTYEMFDDTISGKFDFTYNTSIYRNLGMEAYQQYLKDSLGYTLTILKEEIRPLKIIRFRNF